MALRCNLPEERHGEILGCFGYLMTEDEEEQARQNFTQYIFFKGAQTRTVYCTNCRQRAELHRKDRPEAFCTSHGETGSCPMCGTEAEWRAIGRYQYNMPSLAERRNFAIIRKSGDALLITAAQLEMQYSFDDLFGELWIDEKKRYYLAPGTVQEWKRTWKWNGFEWGDLYWEPLKNISEPFQPNKMGWSDYDGEYVTIGTEQLEETSFRYSQLFNFYYYGYACDLLEQQEESRYVIKYLAAYALYPQIEMAVKFGFTEAVEDLIVNGKKNAKYLNWNAKNPADFMRLTKQEARTYMKSGSGWETLKNWREHGKELTLGRYLSIVEQLGGEGNAAACAKCAAACGVGIEKAARYISRFFSVCAHGLSNEAVLGIWKDYLDMAQQLAYDLEEPTVAMPRDLKERHDAAAALIQYRKKEDEKKKYRKRYRALRQKFEFSLGGLRIVVPECSADIVREGKTLHHCVGGYAARHMEGKTVILFLRHERRPERPFLTIELTTDKKPVVRQIHGYKNEGYGAKQRPEEKYKWFIEPWLAWIADGSRRDKQGNPIMKEEKTA